MKQDEKVDNTPFWRIPQWFPSLENGVLDRVRTFHRELILFNGRINLISNRTEKYADLIHFADCLLACQQLLKASAHREVYDIGSGNGLPGLILASLDSSRTLYLVEKDSRKSEFLKHAASRMGLTNVFVVNKPVEEITEGKIHCCVSRGFASIGKAILAARKACAKDCEYFHFKGDTWVKEISDIPAQVFSHWKPSLVAEYTLPEDAARLCLIVTRRIS